MSYESWRSSAEVAAEVAQGHGSHIRMSEGYINTVAIVDDRLVVKVPKRPECVQFLDHERRALEFMEHVDVEPFIVPRLVSYSDDPAHLVATYVPGQVLTPQEIQSLPKTTRERLGRDVGSYILHQADVTHTRESVKPPIFEADEWLTTFATYVGDFQDMRYPTLSSLTARLYERWSSYRKQLEPSTTALHFIHGDLAPGNIVLTEDYQLSGVIDFARAREGEFADELSCLATADRYLLEVCAKELVANGADVDLEYVMLWRELKDIHVLPWWISTGNTVHPNFQKYRKLIADRYPQLDWSELYP